MFLIDTGTGKSTVQPNKTTMCSSHHQFRTYFNSSNDLLCSSALDRAMAPVEVTPFWPRLTNIIEQKMSWYHQQVRKHNPPAFHAATHHYIQVLNNLTLKWAHG